MSSVPNVCWRMVPPDGSCTRLVDHHPVDAELADRGNHPLLAAEERINAGRHAKAGGHADLLRLGVTHRLGHDHRRADLSEHHAELHRADHSATRRLEEDNGANALIAAVLRKESKKIVRRVVVDLAFSR